MKFITTLSVFFIFSVFSIDLSAQRNCATMDNLELQKEIDPKLDNRMKRIERHTQEFILNSGSRSVDGVITIPVVFHIVYNNTTENLSEAQILTQLDVLNEDFRRLNSDASNTPSDFTGVAADSEIEFCLATVDPFGGATSGITRTSTSSTSFSTNNNVKYDATGGKNAWPSGQYLNYWICDLSGGLLGYAQFPGGNSATDGVVCDYAYTGTIGTSTPPFHLGRTGTHEVGHWLNLRHIWGDGGCSVDDFVSDTPKASGSNTTGSPCTYPGPNSCTDTPTDFPDMFQNYMDYSDDTCMNLFTEGQKTRMRAIFNSGGSRESLLTSNGCGVPQPPTCVDGIQNGDETGIDCGGATCPDCPTCSDGIQNGDEEDIDCGGSSCPACPCNDHVVTITLNFDNYPQETSWEILNMANVQVASGGTYPLEPDGSTLILEECLVDGCYDFTIFDSYGDGLCCGYGNGSYTVGFNGNIVASGGDFDDFETTNFCTYGSYTFIGPGTDWNIPAFWDKGNAPPTDYPGTIIIAANCIRPTGLGQLNVGTELKIMTGVIYTQE